MFESENDSDTAAALALIPDEEIVTVISTDAGLFTMGKTMVTANMAGKVAAAMKPDEFARVLAAGGKAKSAHVLCMVAGKLKKIFKSVSHRR